MSAFTATLAAEPATRRHGWPLLVLLHTALWALLVAALFTIGRTGRDFNLPASGGLGAALLNTSAWVRNFWYFALTGLAFWTAIDGVAMLLLSRDSRGRGYLFWNCGQFALALGTLVAGGIIFLVVFGKML